MSRYLRTRHLTKRLTRNLLTSLLVALVLSTAQAQATEDPAQRADPHPSSTEQADQAYTAATAALSQQNWAEAEIYFERVLMFNPLHAEARVQLALLFAQQGKTASAAGFLQSLVEDPRTPSAHRARLQALLLQLNNQHGPSPASEPVPAPLPAPTARLESKFSLGYTSNPYARADISTLTLTLPEGRAKFPIEQNLSAAPLATASLSYLAPNQCGTDLNHQSWGGPEPQSANRLMLFCYTKVHGKHLQFFASAHQSTDDYERNSLGLSWPNPTWRLTAQIFQEPKLDRQGYALRVDHLLRDKAGASTLLFAEAEKPIATGLPGYIKASLQQTMPVTPALVIWGLLTYQRDFSAYSPLLENGAARSLLLTQVSLEQALGTFAGWQIGSTLQFTNRKSNIEMFEFDDLTVKLILKHIF